MAKNSSKPDRSVKQRIDKSLSARSKQMGAHNPGVSIGKTDLISQAEIVNVLRIRAQLSELKEELLHTQEGIRHRLEDSADVQYGFYTIVSENMQVRIWESDSMIEL